MLPATTSALEELNRALMPLGCGTRGESAEIPAAAGFRILLARIEPVLARFQLPDQSPLLMQRNAYRPRNVARITNGKEAWRRNQAKNGHPR
jgi:hypothetical protein